MNPMDSPLVDLHLFDRDPGLGGEKRHDLLIRRRELTILLFGQVEVPVHDSPHEDRDAEKASHRRMSGRKAEEVRLLRHVGNADRARLPKEDAENAMVAWQFADPSSR